MARGAAHYPRGKVGDLIRAMHAQPEKEFWTRQEMTDHMAIEPRSMHSYLRAAMSNGWIFGVERDGGYVYTIHEPEPEAKPFNAALWTDGDLDLYGLLELDDGGFRVNAENVPVLRRLLQGQLQ